MNHKHIATTLTAALVLAWGFVRHTTQPEWRTDAATLIYQPAPQPSPREVVAQRASRNGWNTGRQWACLTELIRRESGWRPHASSSLSSAEGLFQILKQQPGLPVTKQAELGIKYITHRYGTPCHALAFHDRNNWY